MTDVIDNDFHPDDSGLEASADDHWGTVNAGASTSDAARGLSQAKEDRKLSNNAIGNNQIRTHASRSGLGMVQRAYKEQYN